MQDSRIDEDATLILGRQFNDSHFSQEEGSRKVMVYIGGCEKYLSTLSLNLGTAYELF